MKILLLGSQGQIGKCLSDQLIYNKNEVILIPKNIENKGFFEKFFQLFS